MIFNFRNCLIVLSTMFACLQAYASDNIHYIGFNKFVADNEAESSRVFDDYIHQLRPIMSRYGMTVDAFDVLHGGSAELPADVVTFGSAPDEESFQAFFADPELQEIFPMLVGALGGHEVIFTSGPFSVTGNESGHTLLSLNWVDGDATDGVSRIQALNEKTSSVFGQYGVRQIDDTAGLMSNRGLAAEITPTAPPQLLELWSIRDAHGYFDDPLVQSTNKKAEAIISRSEAFWLKARVIR